MLAKLLELLNGNKTYLVAIATLVYAIDGFFLHTLTFNQAMPYVLAALGTFGIRSALKKLE